MVWHVQVIQLSGLSMNKSSVGVRVGIRVSCFEAKNDFLTIHFIPANGRVFGQPKKRKQIISQLLSIHLLIDELFQYVIQCNTRSWMLYIKLPLIWYQSIVDKILAKHRVTSEEVEEAVCDRTARCSRSRGSYCLWGQSVAGRLLLVVLKKRKGPGKYKVITARDMDADEKRLYRKYSHHGGRK